MLYLLHSKHLAQHFCFVDSATFSRNLAVGIDAFKSSKVLSLTSPSKHLHQPEEGIADLPITSLEHSFRPSTLKDTQLSMPESRESQEMEQTQTLSLLSKQSQMERENASPLSDYDRFGPSEGGHLDRWQTRSNIENPSAHRSHTSPSLQSISASLLPKTSPQSVPKKRRLPSTIRGIKRPSPAMKDTRLDDAFFGNSDSDEELSGVVSNNAAHTALKGTTPGQESSNFGTKAPSCSRRSEQAVDYLTRIVTAMDGEKKSLLSDNHPQLHIINVGSENIFLRRKIND
ncbi:hypothetical protein BCR41DRAFT_54648 [Lobosporangium transversale]|uniref:Uncharacterized protein n=1 Tax=Lobosporangium transversale TaxID=64571 RepID=A0A1Y2GQ66_9FUNG|nr:hypothetical protein BCR41DRAFT_54648 [Lobosporangium transversale]ORZ16734.1 hypothetical protein BCR41DRAFT_54648 [Lobosporangium transversale]|eukprot:XP_021881669.1 hypothetical protein BCR41DRAFT_54648 [Lobosporangium transversale]